MKKLFTLAIVIATMIGAQAVQITWGENLGSDFALKDRSGNLIQRTDIAGATGANGNNYTIDMYLINANWLLTTGVGQTDLIAMLVPGYTGGDSVANYAAHSQSGNTVINMSNPGVFGTMGIFDFYYDGTSSQKTAAKGDEFFVLIVMDFNDGNGAFYQIVENGWTSIVGNTPDPFSQKFGWTGATSTGWQAVPEPLTVGLALAGVALLVAQRRRK